jgi:hypothetical protein
MEDIKEAKKIPMLPPDLAANLKKYLKLGDKKKTTAVWNEIEVFYKEQNIDITKAWNAIRTQAGLSKTDFETKLANLIGSDDLAIQM